MKNKKHTAGEWQFSDSGPKSGNVIRGEVVGPKGQHIADIPCNSIGETGVKRASEVEANGNLIAAAPTLKEAAVEALRVLVITRDDLAANGHSDTYDDICEEAKALTPIINQLKTALAKSNGII